MKENDELNVMSDDELKARAAKNSADWHTAETQEQKDGYHAENVEINKILDSRTGETTTFDPVSGEWSPRKDPSAGGTGGQGGAGEAEPFTVDSAPEYLDRYDELINTASQKIQGRAPFSYDPETDPTYQQYKDQYTRQGKLAMEDTLGQVSARTGGLASSYAGSAAQQSYNQYMSALSDKIPELRQLAYQMYRDEGDDMRADLNMLMQLEQRDYGRYQDKLNQYNMDRSFAYGMERDKVADDQWKQSFDYQVGRDKRQDAMEEDEIAYRRDRDKRNDEIEDRERQVSEAMNIFNATGDVTGLAEAWGLTPDQAQAMIDDYAWQKQLTREEAARQVAAWYAQYGDYSKLEELGVDTGYLEQERTEQQSTGYRRSDPTEPPSPDKGGYSMEDIDPASIAGLGVVNLDFNTIDNLVEEGKLEPYEMENHRLGLRWADGYDANRWWQESGARINSGTERWKGGNR